MLFPYTYMVYIKIQNNIHRLEYQDLEMKIYIEINKIIIIQFKSPPDLVTSFNHFCVN